MFKNKKRVFINIFSILVLVLIARIYIDNNVYEISYINYEDIEIPQSFDGVKILQISDLHNKLYGDKNINLIDDINEISPDYIFLTGDMVSAKDEDFSNFYDLASAIGEQYPCFYILGNHEMDLSNWDRNNIYNTLRSYNIKVLDNEMTQIEKSGDIINVYGMWYNPKYYMKENFYLENMKKILGESQEAFNILLTHNPDDFEVYADWGADLTFSGHVHGGMIRLPFVGGVISPNRSLFPRYDGGLYEYNDSNLIVSKGMSRGATGIRVFNQPELIVVTISNIEN